MIRYSACATVLIWGLAWTSAADSSARVPQAARDLLARARGAMGGEAELAAVRTLSISIQRLGRMKSLAGAATKPLVEFMEDRVEVRILRPDHALWTLALPDVPGVGSVWGFAGPRFVGGGNRLRWRYHEQYGYLMLTMLLQSDKPFPFVLNGVVDNTLRFLDPNGVEVLVDVDRSSHLPNRMTFDALERTNEGAPTGRRLPTRVELADFRSVGRFRLPHVMKTFETDKLVLDERVIRLEINPPLTPADFNR